MDLVKTSRRDAGDPRRVIRLVLIEDPVATLVVKMGNEVVEVRAPRAYSDLILEDENTLFIQLHGLDKVNISSLHAGEEVLVFPKDEDYPKFAEVFQEEWPSQA